MATINERLWCAHETTVVREGTIKGWTWVTTLSMTAYTPTTKHPNSFVCY